MLYMYLVVLLWVLAVINNSHTIVNENGLYLTRYYPFGQLLRKLFNVSVFIHHFHQSDNREFHNHPWKNSKSLILWGGYKEHRKNIQHLTVDPNSFVAALTRMKTVYRNEFKPLSINHIYEDTFHYVELLNEKRGCWTLFFAGENPDEEWGFLKKDGTYESANVRFKGQKDALSGD